MDTGLKGMGRKKNYYGTNAITITVINTRSIKSQINVVARGIRERIKDMNANSNNFVKDMIARGRFEIYIKLLKIDKGSELTDFRYQINSVIKEQRNV